MGPSAASFNVNGSRFLVRTPLHHCHLHTPEKVHSGGRHCKKNARIIQDQSLITCTPLNTSSPSLLLSGSHTQDPFCQEMERGQGAQGQTAGEKEDVLEDTWKNTPHPSDTITTAAVTARLMRARTRICTLTHMVHLQFPPIRYFPTPKYPTIWGGKKLFFLI